MAYIYREHGIFELVINQGLIGINAYVIYDTHTDIITLINYRDVQSP